MAKVAFFGVGEYQFLFRVILAAPLFRYGALLLKVPLLPGDAFWVYWKKFPPKQVTF